MLFSPLELTLGCLSLISISYYIGRETGARAVFRELRIAVEQMPDFDIQIKEEKNENEV